jgi:hypothetical protein
VQNQGNTFFNILRGGTTFDTTFGVPGGGATVKAPTYTILPDSTRTIDASWTPGPVVGSGTADVKLYYNDTSALTAPQAKFVVVPWHLILTVLTLFLLLFGMRMMRRSRRRRKVSAPVESPWITTKAGS